MGLDVYYHIVSQPSRAVLMFCKVNNIKFNGKMTDLFKGKIFDYMPQLRHAWGAPRITATHPVTIACKGSLGDRRKNGGIGLEIAQNSGNSNIILKFSLRFVKFFKLG